MSEYENNELLDIVMQTLEADRQASTPLEKSEQALTFKRDEEGVLWSYDATTGEKVGRVFEHGDDRSKLDTIKEV